MTSLRTTLAAAAIGSVLIFGAACGSNAPYTPPDAAPNTSALPETSAASPSVIPTAEPSSAEPSSAEPSSAGTASSAPPVTTETLLAAAATARKEADGRVSSIEFEDDRTWEVHLIATNGDEQRVRVSADGGSVTSGPTDDRPDREDQNENRALYGVDVDYKEAVKIAEKAVSGGQVRELSLDRDNARSEWEIEVRDGTQQITVTVNADSGAVIGQENDD